MQFIFVAAAVLTTSILLLGCKPEPQATITMVGSEKSAAQIVTQSADLSAPATTSNLVNQALPAVGSYGFNWLTPKTATCAPVVAADIATYKNCDTSRPGFGGDFKPTHACRVNASSEWIIYAQQSHCQSELATMKANEP